MGRQLPANFVERARQYHRLGYTGSQIARTLRVSADTVQRTLAPSEGRAQRLRVTRDNERARRRAVTQALADEWERKRETARERILAEPGCNLLVLSLELGVSLHRLNRLRRELRDVGVTSWNDTPMRDHLF